MRISASSPKHEDGYDAVVSLDALYQASDPSRAMTTITDVLKEGAVLVFTTYCSQHGQLGARYEIDQWITLVQKAGLKLEHVRNVSRFWRKQMGRRHSIRLAKSRNILARDGEKAIPELQVSHRILQLEKLQRSILNSIWRYEIVARKNSFC